MSPGAVPQIQPRGDSGLIFGSPPSSSGMKWKAMM